METLQVPGPQFENPCIRVLTKSTMVILCFLNNYHGNTMTPSLTMNMVIISRHVGNTTVRRVIW